MVEKNDALVNGTYRSDQALITQSNQLIEGSYDITLAEIRLLWFALSKVDSKKPKPESEYTLYATDYSKIYDLELTNCYHQMKSVAETLGSKPIVTYEYNEKKQRMDKVKRWWFSSIRYGVTGGADITLKFSDDVSKLLYELKNEFTQMNISSMTKLDSPFSYRLYSWLSRYKLLSRFNKNGVVITEQISIDWMRDRTGLTGKYTAFKDFRRKVLEPAISTINNTTDFSVNYEMIKSGKVVTHIIFSFIDEKEDIYLRIKPAPPKLPRRPHVLAGSSSEGDWARKCLELLIEYRIKLQDYDKKEQIPMLYLRKMEKYYNIIGDKEAVSRTNEEIEKRKNKKIKSQ